MTRGIKGPRGPQWNNRAAGRVRNQADADAAKQVIPQDTRSLTGRLFGDPLPGRSALDKRA